MSRLIVNADDFGLTPGVNRAILELNRAGLLTSATLMARAPATDEAIDIALKTSTLAVGCHVVLVDGDPILPPQQLPTLTDPQTGRFHPTLGAFLKRLFTGRIHRDDIAAEAEAQMRRLTTRGLRLTHVDTHKHTHMFPAVLEPVLSAAKSAGIRAIRNPFEPLWSRSATPAAPLVRRFEVALLRRFEPAFRKLVAAHGFSTTDGAIGVLATGTLDASTIASLLRAMPEGAWELVTHPGYNDSALAQANTRLLTSRAIELEALRTLQQFPTLHLTSFAEDGARTSQH